MSFFDDLDDYIIEKCGISDRITLNKLFPEKKITYNNKLGTMCSFKMPVSYVKDDIVYFTSKKGNEFPLPNNSTTRNKDIKPGDLATISTAISGWYVAEIEESKEEVDTRLSVDEAEKENKELGGNY